MYARSRSPTRGLLPELFPIQPGPVVAGAQIEARNLETGVLFQGGTSNTGNYVLRRCPLGRYEVAITVSGFKKFVEQNVQVIVATDTRKDVNLEVGSTTETLTVDSGRSVA